MRYGNAGALVMQKASRGKNFCVTIPHYHGNLQVTLESDGEFGVDTTRTNNDKSTLNAPITADPNVFYSEICQQLQVL